MKKVIYLTAIFAGMAFYSCSSNSSANASAADTTVADSAPACSEEGHHPMDRPDFNPNDMIQHRTDEMAKELNLDDEQKAKIVEILTAGVSDMEAAKGDTARPNPEKMKAMRDAENEKIKAVLTDEQKTKFEEMMKAHKDDHHHGPHDGHGPHGHGPHGDGPAPEK